MEFAREGVDPKNPFEAMLVALREAHAAMGVLDILLWTLLALSVSLIPWLSPLK